jgi:hypothetical protein
MMSLYRGDNDCRWWECTFSMMLDCHGIIRAGWLRFRSVIGNGDQENIYERRKKKTYSGVYSDESEEDSVFVVGVALNCI